MNQEEVIRSFYSGMIQGVARYAYWRDGTQYVGTTGRTLKEAVQEIRQEQNRMLEKVKTL